MTYVEADCIMFYSDVSTAIATTLSAGVYVALDTPRPPLSIENAETESIEMFQCYSEMSRPTTDTVRDAMKLRLIRFHRPSFADSNKATAVAAVAAAAAAGNVMDLRGSSEREPLHWSPIFMLVHQNIFTMVTAYIYQAFHSRDLWLSVICLGL